MQFQTNHFATGNKNYYHIINVNSSATPAEISKAFKKLALKWHPDRHSEFKKTFAHQKFVNIVEAYEVLGDPAKRIRYDAYREYRQSFRAGSRSAYSGSTYAMTAQAEKKPFKKNLLFEMSLKFDKELQKWCKKADLRARKLAKKSYLQFAVSLDVITRLTVQGIVSTLDVITGDKNNKNSLKQYKKKLKEFPGDDRLHFRIGFIYHQNHEHEKAEKHYLKSLKLNSKNADVFCNLGRLREEQNNYTRAVRCYKRAVQINPDLHVVYACLGILHLKIEQYTEAKTCFDLLVAGGRKELAAQIEKAYLANLHYNSNIY